MVGKLIVFEGLDRAGKTTQAVALATSLSQKGIPTKVMAFPARNTSTGQAIDAYLKSNEGLSPQAVHLLFSANRWAKEKEIRDLLNAGTHVILDRYVASGVAYSMAKGLDRDWCEQSDRGLPVPDLQFYLDIYPEAAARRGNYGGERYENLDFQKKVRGAYEALKRDSNWISLDASLNPGELSGRIEAEIQ